MQRRSLIGSLLVLGAGSSASASGEAEVWVTLSQPALASLPRDADAERQAQQRRVAAQQDEVMAALRALGGVELSRVQVARNALAVRLPAMQLDAARRLPGVVSVRPVRHVDRAPPKDPAQ